MWALNSFFGSTQSLGSSIATEWLKLGNESAAKSTDPTSYASEKAKCYSDTENALNEVAKMPLSQVTDFYKDFLTSLNTSLNKDSEARKNLCGELVDGDSYGKFTDLISRIQTKLQDQIDKTNFPSMEPLTALLKEASSKRRETSSKNNATEQLKIKDASLKSTEAQQFREVFEELKNEADALPFVQKTNPEIFEKVHNGTTMSNFKNSFMGLNLGFYEYSNEDELLKTFYEGKSTQKEIENSSADLLKTAPPFLFYHHVAKELSDDKAAEKFGNGERGRFLFPMEINGKRQAKPLNFNKLQINENGDNALMAALKNDKPMLLAAMIKSGGFDLFQANKLGETPMQLLCSKAATDPQWKESFLWACKESSSENSKILEESFITEVLKMNTTERENLVSNLK